MAATSHARSLGVPCSQYIDDRHVGQLAPCHRPSKPDIEWSNLEHADAAAFICASILISLLGFIMDSTLCAFLIPEVKKKKFADLRESILKGRSVSVRTLQRFAGKKNAFVHRRTLSSTVCPGDLPRHLRLLKVFASG